MDWLLEIIKNWLAGHTLWVPTAAFLVFLPQVIQWAKRLLPIFQMDWLNALTKGWGARGLAAIIAAATLALNLLGDGSMTGLDLAQIIWTFITELGITIGSAFFLHWATAKPRAVMKNTVRGMYTPPKAAPVVR